MDLENPLVRREACPFGVDLVLGMGLAGGFLWELNESYGGTFDRMSCGIRSCVTSVRVLR